MSLEFKNKTNWYTITGAPSSGKTSVIKELAKRGYAIQEEVAREIIEQGISRGLSLADIRRDVRSFQHSIIDLKLERAMALDTEQVVIFDRGVPDSITYFKLAGLDSREVYPAAQLFQYRAVFIFNRLPLEADEVRTEDEEQANKLDRQLEEDYRSIGYKPIRVPVMAMEKRADFVLQKIKALS